MGVTIAKEQANLQKLTTKELRERYEEVFRERCLSNNRIWLIRRILWRMQAHAEGDLSTRARQRALEIADDADLRIHAPRQKPVIMPSAARTLPGNSPSHDPRLPPVGSVLVKRYKGRDVQVTILNDGFEWEGETYGTLSAVAKAITGSHVNGFQFFKIQTGGRR